MSERNVPYDQLPFTNNFIFCKVLSHDLDLTRQLLQLILQMPIREVKLSEAEKTLTGTPDSRSVRFDVYAEDADGTVFDIEMQTTDDTGLGKRMRYYQGMIDVDRSERGMSYEDLPRSYVIFICLEKPAAFDLDLPLYRFREICLDDSRLELGDETEKIIVDAAGPQSGLSEEMRCFMQYLQGGIAGDDFTRGLDAGVTRARRSKGWRKEFMTYEQEINLAARRAEKKALEKGRKEEQERIVRHMSQGGRTEYEISELIGLPQETVHHLLMEKG